MRHYSDYNNKDEYWHFGVDEEQGLLDFLLANAKESRTKVKATLKGRGVKVDGKTITQFDFRLMPGMKVSVSKTKRNQNVLKNRFVKIVYEDRWLVVVEKAPGILSMAAGHSSLNVKAVLDDYFHKSRQNCRAHVVHRLDRDTSGVMMLAKTRKALVKLHEMIREGELHKSYKTLVLGDWVNDRQHIKAPLYKFVSANGERRVCVDAEKGLPSHSIFQLIERFGPVSYLAVDLKTGRTHQIRVHAQYAGHPLVGDDKYGDFEENKKIAKGSLGVPFKRMFLHAYRLEFKHPITGRNLCITAELPAECADLINELKKRKEN